MEVTTPGYAVGNVWGMKRPQPRWKKRTPDQRRPTFFAAWREHREMTQEELADRLETTKATISRIENGEIPYSQDFLEMCSDILGVHHSVLLTRAPTPADTIQMPPPARAAARGSRR